MYSIRTSIDSRPAASPDTPLSPSFFGLLLAFIGSAREVVAGIFPANA